MAFFNISIDSLYLQESVAQGKKIEKNHTHSYENPENFTFEILKTSQDFDSAFFNLSHLCYRL